jgi:hypothetical protein
LEKTGDKTVSARRFLLDDVIPRYDVHEIHDIWLPVSVGEALRAVRTVRSDEIRLFKPLFSIRMLPKRFERGAPRLDLSTPILNEFIEKGGFAMIAEQQNEVVLGSIGHFWKIKHNRPLSHIRNTEQFRGFNEPGYTKVAINFAAFPEGTGSRLFTETRVEATSEEARRSFGRYWWVVSPGSALLRRSWLKAILRRAKGE